MMPTATLARRILAKDLVAAVEAIGKATGALGALAFEQGIDRIRRPPGMRRRSHERHPRNWRHVRSAASPWDWNRSNEPSCMDARIP